MLTVPLCPSRIFVTSSSRLYSREIYRSFSTLKEPPPSTAPKKTRTRPPSRTPNTTRSTDVTKRPQTVQPQSKQRRLLQPYELSTRLIALCQRGDADLAVSVLQSAPKNAQNVKVWNTLIQQCMDAKKYKIAFQVFVDMKRRGFMPNVRTYATLMSGYATVENWESFTKQLGYAHSIYVQLKLQLENLAEDHTSGTGASSLVQYPIALYISILGKAGKYQKTFDVFHELDTDGPLAPHPKVYSSLLCLSADRMDPETEDAEATTQAVSDAKYVWRRHIRSLDRQSEHYIEPRSVEAIVKVLSRGESSDLELMFDILRDICGLPRLGEDRPPSSSPPPKVEPTLHILSEVLDSCTVAGRPEMAIHYAQFVMDSPKLQHILRVWHLSKLLRAHTVLAREGSTFPARSENAAAWIVWFLAQGREESVPNKSTLIMALGLCQRCGDMPSALRIARAVLEGRMRGSVPAKAWVHLLGLAAVAPPNEKRQCLELLARNNSVLDVWESGSAIERMVPLEKKDHVSLARCIVQLLRTPPALPDRDAAGGDDAVDAGQAETWSDIKRRAKLFLERAH